MTVTPTHSNLDDPVSIHVSHLHPGSEVTLDLQLHQFFSQTKMVAPQHGNLVIPDCRVMLGLMEPTTDNQDQRLFTKKRPIVRNLEYSVTARQGNRETMTSFYREVYGSKVVRKEVQEGPVRGTLYLPPGHHQRPGVLCMSGSSGVEESIPAYLASKGFTTLGLGYFGMPGLPKTYSSISLEYLHQAVSLLEDHCQSGGLGVLGRSKGGDLGLALAITLGSRIRKVVTLNGCIGSAGGEITYNGQTMFPPVSVNPKFLKSLKSAPRVRENVLDCQGAMEEVTHHNILPVEKAEAEIVMVAGDEDHNWDSVRYAQQALEQCLTAGRDHLSIQIVPGLGHLVDIPYTPVCDAIDHAMTPPGVMVYMGGQDRERNTMAQAEVMDRVLQVFGEMKK